MARKRSRTGQAKEQDWRATLFVWRGEISTDEHERGHPKLEWVGAWAGTDDASMPSAAALDSSENGFRLATRRFDDERIVAEGEAEAARRGIQGDAAASAEIFEVMAMGPWCCDDGEADASEVLFPVAGLGVMELEGQYSLDNGEGRQPFEDDAHRVQVRVHADEACAAAVGAAPFGKFVSLGVIDGYTLTLARRYISDDDARAAWASPKDVLDALLVAGEPLALDDVPTKLPWKVEA